MLNIHTDLISIQTIDENEFWLLMHIAKRIDANRACFPSNYTLRNDTGFGKEKLHKVKTALIAKGFMGSEMQMQEGRFTSNLYTIKTPFISCFVNLKDLGQLKEDTADIIEKPKRTTVSRKSVHRKTGDREPDHKVLTSMEVLISEEVLINEKESTPPFLDSKQKSILPIERNLLEENTQKEVAKLEAEKCETCKTPLQNGKCRGCELREAKEQKQQKRLVAVQAEGAKIKQSTVPIPESLQDKRFVATWEKLCESGAWAMKTSIWKEMELQKLKAYNIDYVVKIANKALEGGRNGVYTKIVWDDSIKEDYDKFQTANPTLFSNQLPEVIEISVFIAGSLKTLKIKRKCKVYDLAECLLSHDKKRIKQTGFKAGEGDRVAKFSKYITDSIITSNGNPINFDWFVEWVK